MTSNAELKSQTNTPTLHLVLLTIATAGIYPLMWLYKHIPAIAAVTGKPIVGRTFLIWMAVCVGLGAGLSGTGEEDLDAIAGLFTLAGFILYIVLAFKLKAALESYAANTLEQPLKLDVILTFGFTIYYINYRINKLAEAQ